MTRKTVWRHLLLLSTVHHHNCLLDSKRQYTDIILSIVNHHIRVKLQKLFETHFCNHWQFTVYSTRRKWHHMLSCVSADGSEGKLICKYRLFTCRPSWQFWYYLPSLRMFVFENVPSKFFVPLYLAACWYPAGHLTPLLWQIFLQGNIIIIHWLSESIQYSIGNLLSCVPLWSLAFRNFLQFGLLLSFLIFFQLFHITDIINF